MKPWVLPASAALHLAGLAALLPWPTASGQAEAPPVEVELVQRRELVEGSAPATEPDTTPDASPLLPMPPLPPGTEPPPRPPEASRRTAARPQASAVNLGNASESRDGLDVTGRNIVPPLPDSKFRNQPPPYPAEAARVGAQGTVGLMVQVSAAGIPTQVTVASSSGTNSLDREARNAVRRWRFTPARIQGTAVPFEYSLDIRFIIEDQQ